MLAVFLSFFLSHFAMASGPSIQNDLLLHTSAPKAASMTAAELLDSLKVNPAAGVRLQAEWLKQSTPCGGGGYYYLKVVMRGEFEGKTRAVALAVQTLDETNLHRIYDAIRANLATKGLPRCLLNDTYSGLVTHVFQPYELVNFFPAGRELCSGFWFPVTSCVTEENLYE